MEFRIEYVRCTWSPELEGKEVSHSDSIHDLWQDVIHSRARRERCEKGSTLDYPFKCGNAEWRYVYYDPFFDLRLAHEQGKTIQYLIGEEWNDVHEPSWDCELERYRIKPDEPEEEKPVTNRELARWLAQCNGEWSYRSGDVVHSHYVYSKGDADKPVEETIRIRKWDDEEWQGPSRGYMGLEA